MQLAFAVRDRRRVVGVRAGAAVSISILGPGQAAG